MILAAAQFGERKQGVQPPEALSLGFQCRRWGVAALMEVPAPRWLLEQMATALNVYDAFRAHKDTTMDDAKWSTYNPGYWKVMMDVEKLRHPELFVRRVND